MAKKILKKAQTEGPVTKSRTVTKGPLGLTKTIVKTKTYADKDPVVTTKTRNTVKGALNNVGAKFRRPPVGDYPFTPADSNPFKNSPIYNRPEEESVRSLRRHLRKVKVQKKVGGSIKKK